MNVQSIVVLIAVAVLAVIAIIYCVKNKNKISCGGDCSNCSSNCKKDNK